MEHKFEWTIPWVAFSKHVFTGSVEWYVEFLKELEKELYKVPDIFWVNPNDKLDVRTRLEKQNKFIVEMIQKFPEVKEWMDNKENNGI